MNKKLMSKYGNPFEMESYSYEDYISVLAAGYIITPSGMCVIVPDDKDHSDVFSTYIYKYLEKQYSFYQLTEAIEILTGDPCNCVVYCGIRPGDVIALHNPQINKKYNSEGWGVLFFPIKSELTEEQKMACQSLISSNKSLFGDREKIPLQYGLINGKEFTKEQAEELINTNKKTR